MLKTVGYAVVLTISCGLSVAQAAPLYTRNYSSTVYENGRAGSDVLAEAARFMNELKGYLEDPDFLDMI